ncbi:MAG: hypothetical protein PHV39_09205, partial [Methanomicrobium sp.]|nr:hypothetical protein [Methanomicrobium sp.]
RIITALSELSLWKKIGVENEPTIDILIEQLKTLESGMSLKSDERERVRMVLSRDPNRVIKETGHCLSLDSSWLPISKFSYYLSNNLKGGVDSLFSHVKKETVDLRMNESGAVPEIFQNYGLKDLQSSIFMRLSNVKNGNGKEETRPWMATLGGLLSRVQNEKPEEELKIREIGARISNTIWTPVEKIEITPYIGEIPAGREQNPDVYWDDIRLYVKDVSAGRLLDLVPSELKRGCQINDVSIAIERCYDRNPELVKEYCMENFSIISETEVTLDCNQSENNNLNLPSDDRKGIIHFSEMKNTFTDDTNIVKGNVCKKINEGSKDSSDVDEHIKLKESENVPVRHSLIDIFTDNLQYKINPNSQKYFHSDGSWIEKSEKPFNWEIRSQDGELIVQLWIHEGFLSRGIEMPADVYGVIEKNPKATAIILRAEDNGADVISGTQLISEIKKQELGLYPAKYRLRRIVD